MLQVDNFRERMLELSASNDALKRDQARLAQETASVRQLMGTLRAQIHKCLEELDQSRAENERLRMLISPHSTSPTATASAAAAAPATPLRPAPLTQFVGATPVTAPPPATPCTPKTRVTPLVVSSPLSVAASEPFMEASLTVSPTLEGSRLDLSDLQLALDNLNNLDDLPLTPPRSALHEECTIEPIPPPDIPPPDIPPPDVPPPEFLSPAAAPLASPHAQPTPFVDVSLPPATPPDTVEALIRDCHGCGDINIAGLHRGKKKPLVAGGKLQMEDRHFCQYPWNGNKDRALFCVFDGFAGKEASQAAMKLLPKELYKRMDAAGEVIDLTSILCEVFAEVDRQMKSCEYMGSTCTVVVLWRVGGKRLLQAANVGDSSAYLWRDGAAIHLSEPHKATSPSERQRLLSVGIKMEPKQTRINGVAVSRALGIHFIKENSLGVISSPFVSPVYTLTTADTALLVCSDGVRLFSVKRRGNTTLTGWCHSVFKQRSNQRHPKY
eukprot:TRINITY_DN4056_c0_g1_i2.p1 TRINITY_DN4056_c0_g1~~TRINITY_DN4056_c0_g1_i2.p1  ORF type:complete len:497 (-),score=101.20 TRINITY_DN4056_c0_g1_i2:51-1541(-)